MANVSFANLNSGFDMGNPAYTAFSGTSGVFGFSSYSFATTGGHDWEMAGNGITNDGAVPTGGTVTRLALDINDDDGVFAVDITNIANVPAVDFEINSGTADDQNNAFWLAALQGDDVFDFTGADLAQGVRIAGDGADINDGATHIGGNDTLQGGAFSGSGDKVGDFINIANGIGVGGDDVFTIGARSLLGDFVNISGGATGFGGDDIFTPLEHNFAGAFLIFGDANGIDSGGALGGGNDLIDARNTDLTNLIGDDIRFFGDSFSVSGTLVGGDDTIHGTARADEIYGEAQVKNGTITGGDDLLYGYGGNDFIEGDTGNDEVWGGSGFDSLSGGDGDDTVKGEGGNDDVFGDDGDDMLEGGVGNDLIQGGNGADTLKGGTGNDRPDGGAGDDLVMGDGGNDTLRGAGGNDTLDGGDGADNIFGGTGADVANGGAQDDRIRPEAGNDTVNGGLGDDRIFGSFGFDSLSGNNGDDLVDGNGGNDTLIGGNGEDTLIGNFGFDSLRGGANNDSLEGSGGNDTVTGGSGNDVFLFGSGDDNDVYTDFMAGAGTDDVIELSGFGASFDTFAEVFAAASQAGSDVVIDFGGGDTITLFNTNVGDLHQDDFMFS